MTPEFYCERTTIERGNCPCIEQCRVCQALQAQANVQREPSAWMQDEEIPG